MCNCLKANLLNRQGAAIILILIVDLLWVSSSELTQSIFHNASYNHPFFLSYFNTSLFTIYALFFFPLYFNSFKKWHNNSNINNKSNHIPQCSKTLSQSVIRIQTLENHKNYNCYPSNSPDIINISNIANTSPIFNNHNNNYNNTTRVLNMSQSRYESLQQAQTLKLNNSPQHEEENEQTSPDVSIGHNYSQTSTSYDSIGINAPHEGQSLLVTNTNVLGGEEIRYVDNYGTIDSPNITSKVSKKSNKVSKVSKFAKIFHPRRSKLSIISNSKTSMPSKTTFRKLKSGDNNGLKRNNTANIDISTHSCCITSIPPNQLSLSSTFKLSILFCLIWFLMTFTFNVSLNYTSVASNSIISSMSSPFCWTLSLIFLRNRNNRNNDDNNDNNDENDDNNPQQMEFRVSCYNVIGILVTVAGSIAIAYLDSGSNYGFDALTTMVFGDVFALISAFIYALYVTLIKHKIGNESRVNMFLFFGFIGVINLCILWPFVIILDVLGWEIFVMPDLKILIMLIINGLLTVFSDYLWAQSILLSTPLIATVGLSLQMPIAMAMDEVFRNETHSIMYWISAGAVWVGFLCVNLDLKKQNEKE